MTVPADNGPAPRYRFGPLEGRGGFAGWRTGQVVAVGTGLALAVVVLRIWPDVLGAVTAITVVTAAGAVATVPIAGRTLDAWVPDTARHLLATWSRAPGRFREPPWVGVGIVEAGPDQVGRGMRAPTVGPSSAALFDGRAGTLTAVLAVASPGFVLAGSAEQGARVAAWSQVLASLARPGGGVHRFQWVELLRRGAADRARTDAVVLRRPGGPEVAWADYLSLLRSEPVQSAMRHEVLLAVTVRVPSGARRNRAAGGIERGAAGLARQLVAVRDRLGQAGLTVSAPLGAGALEALLREAASAGNAACRTSGGEEDAGTSPWPVTVERRWESLRTDDAWHATYWVEQWPRVDVGPDALASLLLCEGVERTVAMVLDPVPAADGLRRAEQARTAQLADSELRRAGGFLETARRRRTSAAVVAREQELADGHAPYRFSAYVRVTAVDRDVLEGRCALVEQAAAQASLELRRCYGDQAAAWMATLPLGRGLR